MSASFTIGILAKKYGLSRSALLYYDTIGLLSPALHCKGDYRIYSVDDEKRLQLICRYRRAGISLLEIKNILDSPETSFSAVLGRRFEELNREILRLHDQQRLIADLLQNSEMLKDSEIMTKERWVSLLQASGYSEEDMRKWHIQFEQSAPEKHLAFLKCLQIGDEEIREIRSWKNDV
jgi:DNA-binding transcriptional MerR regulator